MLFDIYIPDREEHLMFSQIVDFLYDKRINQKEQSKRVSILESEGAKLFAKSSIAYKINKLLTHQSDLGAILIRLGSKYCVDVPNTPLDHLPIDQHLLYGIDTIRLALIGAAFGKAYSYNDQAFGKLCDDVMPIKSFDSFEGFSQGKNVGWHTEDAAYNTDEFDSSFDVLSLVFLRANSHDFISISFPNLNDLSSDSIEKLKSKNFKSLASIAHKGDINSPKNTKSIILNRNGYIEYRFSFARVHEQYDYYESLKLKDCLVELKNNLDYNSIDVLVKSGEIIFFDNKRAFHSRKDYFFPPKYDGADRWQRRLGFCNEERFAEIKKLCKSDARVVDNAELLKLFG